MSRKQAAASAVPTPLQVIGAVSTLAVLGGIEYLVAQERISVAGLVLLSLMLGLLCPPRYSAAVLGLFAVANLKAIPFIPIRGGIVLELPVAAVALAAGMITRGGHRVRMQPDWIKLWGAGLAMLAFLGIASTQFGRTASDLSAVIELSQPFTVPFCAGFVFAVALSRDGAWKVAGAVMFAALTVNATLRIAVFAVGDPQSLIQQVFHPTLLRTVVGGNYDTASAGGAIRIVAPFNRMLPWAWSMSLAAVIIAGPKLRRQSIALLVLFSLAIYLNYGRQMYIGLIITSVFAMVFAERFIGDDRALAKTNVARLRWSAVAAGATLVAAAVLTSSSSGANRLQQVFAVGSNNDKTSLIRLKALNGLLGYMKGIDDWAFGSGFLSVNDVGSRTVAAAGGFYNSDLGLIVVLMPLGLIGVAALVTGVAGLVRSSMRALRAVNVNRPQDAFALQAALAGSALYFVFFLAVSTSLFLPQSATLGVALAFAIGIAAISEANQPRSTTQGDPETSVVIEGLEPRTGSEHRRDTVA